MLWLNNWWSKSNLPVGSQVWKEEYTALIDVSDFQEYLPELLLFIEDLIESDMWFVLKYQLMSMHTPDYQGFVLKVDREVDREFLKIFHQFVVDTLTKKHKYEVSNKELICQKKDHLVNKEHLIVLKPAFDLDLEAHQQFFGNISLSYLDHDGKSWSYKMQTHYKHGEHYATPLRMVDLLKTLLELA